jgi:PAS domain S-box-containing protein
VVERSSEPERPTLVDAATLGRQLAAAQQITHIGSWEWAVGGDAVSWSDELYRIYGLEPQSRPITFDFFLSCLHPDDRERVRGHVAHALAHGGRFHYPERIVRPDGSVRELDTVGEALRDEAGRVVGLIGTCRDVTDERRRDHTIELYGNIVENVQIGLVVFRVEDVSDVRDATLVAGNPAAERVLDVILDPSGDARLGDLFPGDAGDQLGRLLVAVARDQQVREIEDHPFASAPARAFSVKAFPLPGACVGVAIQDVTAHARARRLLALEQRVLEMVASGARLAELLRALVLGIEEQLHGAIASVLLVEHDGATARVRHGAAPHLPAAYNMAIDGAAIGPAQGSCGTAAFLKKPVFVADIESDPLWDDYRDLARPFGLRACWSSPIFAGDGRVLGTFAVYHREPHAVTAEELEVVARATHVAGLAIERRQLDDQLRALSAYIEEAREEERTGIAREIHDVVGQAMTAIKIDLAWMARRAAADGPVARDVLLAKIADLSHTIDATISQVRRISSELRPGELDDLGLVAALEWQADEFEKRTAIRAAVSTNLGGERVDRKLATAIFRIAQEALTNVARHAEARSVEVRLERSGDALRLEVRDDGKGITTDQANRPRSLGLLGMRERARALGGSATIGPASPCGTVVAVDVPWPAAP